MEELKDRSKRVMGTIGEKRVDMLQRWEEKSRDFIVSFLLLFGRDGPIVSLFKVQIFKNINNVGVFFLVTFLERQ